MTTLTTHALIEHGRLRIDMPTSLPTGQVEVDIIVRERSSAGRKRDLSNLVGKLSYKGDPMKLQKEMRDEWCD